MRILLWIGVVVLALGILSFFVPLPHDQRHSVRIGDERFSVEKHEHERVQPVVGVTLVVVGAALMIAGSRSR